METNRVDLHRGLVGEKVREIEEMEMAHPNYKKQPIQKMDSLNQVCKLKASKMSVKASLYQHFGRNIWYHTH